MLYRSGRTAAAGLFLGALVSLAFGRILGSLFVGIRPLEPVILLTALCFTAVAILGATYLPARRAARVDPVKTLNAD